MKSIIALALIACIACHVTVSELELQSQTNNQDIINIVNSSQSTWTAGNNSRFNNVTLKEFSSLLGALETPRAVLENELPTMEYSQLSDLPEEFDLRTAHPQCESLQEVRDQSTCGSCWAFAAAEVMSDRICIHSGYKLQTRVSTEDLLTCCLTCGFGCNGGYPMSAFKYWASSGLVSGGAYADTTTCRPYAFPPCEHHTTGKYPACGASKPTPKCEKSCQSGYPKAYSQDKTYGTAYSVPRKEEQIKQEIFTKGSVEAAFTVYADFPTYKTGVYQHKTGGALGGHAVKIIGWGVENGTNYWLVTNSWNEDWGNQGQFKILRGKDHCGIESQIVTGMPKLDEETLKFLQDE